MSQILVGPLTLLFGVHVVCKGGGSVSALAAKLVRHA